MWRAAALSVVLCSAQRALAGCSKCSKNLYTGACTGANHKRDCCNDSAGAIAGLVIFIIIVACGCGICVYFCVQQSRSKNVPPPEQQPLMATPAQGQEHIQVGGRRPSTIQFASVAAMARHPPSAQVMVPAGAGPGTLVSAPHNGQTVHPGRHRPRH